MRRIASVLAVCAAGCSGGGDMFGNPGPEAPDVRIAPAFPALAFDRPLFITAVPGAAQLAVATQAGVVHVFDNRADVAASAVLLDIRDRVEDGGELGLLGLAFDPDFEANGFLYVNYTADTPLRTVIARFTVAGGVADPASEAVLLEYAQPFTNHNGGMLAFGADGMLYVASGDGGSGNDPQDHAQRLDTVLGKILRLNPVPGNVVPADNPFVGTAGARGEIWAYGLRNPWRFGFDRATGLLWVADVGQNAREEIDVVVAGGNYGWRVYEGTRSNVNPGGLPASNFIAPVFEYDHSQGESVTGGYVYRGTAVPELAGRYVYGDFVSGRVWSLAVTGSAASDNQFIGTVPNPSSFGEDAAGELYITAFDGRIYRLEADPD